MREESLFAAALGMRHSAERREFLDRACAGDLALRERLGRLLAADEQSSGILELPGTPPGAPGETWPPPDLGPREAREGLVVAGRYRLVEVIGEGGMGKVWLAEQTEPVRRKVALKLVRPGVGSRSVLARFEAERQALALMDHPNIAKVLDGGAADDGRPYFVMEYVEGVPLTQYCDRARLGVAERLRLFVSVCQAVQHAHTKGIIHRDLKPSNVLVATYVGVPVPKVIDFGVAKASGPRPADWRTLTEHGQLIGTPLYMSPEQAEVGGQDVDTRSDIYSLGVILHELLTGSPPFDANGDVGFFELLRVIREEEPRPPSLRLACSADLKEVAASRGTDPARLCRSVRGELDWVVAKALEKDRSRRYQTAIALAADVQNVLHHGPVSACPPTIGYRLRKFIRRHRGPVLAACMVTAALVAGIIGTTWNMLRATDALEAARRSEHQANERMFSALLNQARAGRFSRQMGQRLDSLAALDQATRIRSDKRLRDEAIAALALPDLRRVPALYAPPAGSVAVAYGCDYRRFAHVDPQGEVSIRNIPDDGEVRRIDAAALRPVSLQFSPDDRSLLVQGPRGEIGVFRVADGKLVLSENLKGITAHAFRPDSRVLAVALPGRVRCFELEAGRDDAEWKLPGLAYSMAFRPDGRALALGFGGVEGVTVFDSRDGTRLARLPVGELTGQVVAWHPDGRRLAVSGAEPHIQLWDVAARSRIATLSGHVQRVTDLAFHPAGGLLASYSWDGTLRLWDPATGRPLLQLPLTIDSRLRFSPDGRWLAAGRYGDQLELLEVTPSRVYRTLASDGSLGRGAYTPADISPDGRLLAVGSVEDGAPGVRIWDLAGGRQLAALPDGVRFVFFDGPHGWGKSPECYPGPGAALLTSGNDGLLRWPVTGDGPDGRHLRLGRPRVLSPYRRAWFARRPGGAAVGASTEEGGANTILDLESGAVRWDLGKLPEGGEVRAVSPDGRWAASCGWHSTRVRLWDLRTGQSVHAWDLGKRNFVEFSPDSRFLVISREDEFTFWDLKTLRPTRRLVRDVAHFPGHVAFSPDGRLTALEMQPGVIHLLETETGRTVARLEDPFGDRATWQGFTPDGARLVVVSAYASAIHVWDLRGLRAQLKERRLDWDWPEFGPEPPPAARTDALSFEYLPAEVAARGKVERFRRAYEARPDSAYACNSLAWVYLTAPEGLRDVEAALPLAEKAVQRMPGEPSFRNTLGVAYYRAGRYKEAVETFRANMVAAGNAAPTLDLYFLAMSLHKQGDASHARDLFGWAATTDPSLSNVTSRIREELDEARAEAEEVLGIRAEDGAPLQREEPR